MKKPKKRGPKGLTESIVPMDLTSAEKKLMKKACTGVVGEIRVSKLDKGLSGASVWLVRWSLKLQGLSAPHVMKIGDYDKLKSEERRVKQFVAPVSPSEGHIKLFGPVDDTERKARIGLLRQQFIGHKNGQPESLKQWLNIDMHERCNCDRNEAIRLVRGKISELYTRRMSSWWDGGSQPKKTTLRKELVRRLKKSGPHFDGLERSIGSTGLAKSLRERGLPDWKSIDQQLDTVLDFEDEFAQCLTHGDLHAQNVLTDDQNNFHLIDFAWSDYGWKAVDFLMLECSLKFLVMPSETEVSDLIAMEQLLDDKANALDREAFGELLDRICGDTLQIYAIAIAAIREQAIALCAVTNADQYRRGLIAMTASLCGIPGLHRPYLAHSLAYHSAKMRLPGLLT